MGNSCSPGCVFLTRMQCFHLSNRTQFFETDTSVLVGTHLYTYRRDHSHCQRIPFSFEIPSQASKGLIHGISNCQHLPSKTLELILQSAIRQDLFLLPATTSNPSAGVPTTLNLLNWIIPNSIPSWLQYLSLVLKTNNFDLVAPLNICPFSVLLLAKFPERTVICLVLISCYILFSLDHSTEIICFIKVIFTLLSIVGIFSTLFKVLVFSI